MENEPEILCMLYIATNVFNYVGEIQLQNMARISYTYLEASVKCFISSENDKTLDRFSSAT
jgi:predicted transcriptional regulator